MRLTVIGSGTSQPQAETPASGLLVESDSTALLVDCGQGVVRELLAVRDPRDLDAIVIGHMHADHYIDLVSLRYLLPWEGVAGAHVPVLLPPGGKARLDALATAISERPNFFDDAYSLLEYDPAHRLHVGDLTITFVQGRHYVPAWGCVITDEAGARIAISGDTGPNEAFVTAARGADVVVAEATLTSAEFDDPRRGHLTPEEALDRPGRSSSSISGPSSAIGSTGCARSDRAPWPGAPGCGWRSWPPTAGPMPWHRPLRRHSRRRR